MLRRSAITVLLVIPLLPGSCPRRVCSWVVRPLGGGEPRTIVRPGEFGDARIDGYFTYDVERDDLLLIRGSNGLSVGVARCSLAQARCVLIRR